MSHRHLWTEATDNILNTIIFHSSRLLQHVGAFARKPFTSLCGCACSITQPWDPTLMTPFSKLLTFGDRSFWCTSDACSDFLTPSGIKVQVHDVSVLNLWTHSSWDLWSGPLLSPQPWVGAELLLANSRSGLWLRAACTSASPHLLAERRGWLQRGRPPWWDHLGQKLNC